MNTADPSKSTGVSLYKLFTQDVQRGNVVKNGKTKIRKRKAITRTTQIIFHG